MYQKMPNMSDYEILRMCAMLAEDLGLRVLVKKVKKITIAIVIATATIIGGLLGERTGLLAGASLGCVVAMLLTDEFKSVSMIIYEELTLTERKILINDIRNFLTNFVEETDEAVAAESVLVNEDYKKQVLKIIKRFFLNELEMVICQPFY